MTIAYLNGEYLPLEQARISPMDRGFLFADAVYEVLPSSDGRFVGFKQHMQRLQNNLDALEITQTPSNEEWRDICETLLARNGAGNLAVYLQISRGEDSKRQHVFPQSIAATLFGFAFEIKPPRDGESLDPRSIRVASQQDLRWQRCHIKSTALLGNLLHLQQGVSVGNDEVLLFNAEQNITEGATCNVFVVNNGIVATPPLEQNILPGVTRQLTLDILEKHSSIPLEVRPISLIEAKQADEIWFTSSSRELAPVVELDDEAVGDGSAGAVWQQAQSLFTRYKHSF